LAVATLELPPLLGYMISGCILGPFSMKYISNSDSNGYIKEIGEIGLLMLLFVTGLELDIAKFTKNKEDLIKPIKFNVFQVLSSVIFVMSVVCVPKSILYIFIDNAFITSIAALGLFFAYIYVSPMLEETLKKINILYILIPLGGIVFWSSRCENSILFNISMQNIQIIILTIFLLSINSAAITIKLLENREKKESHVGTSLIGVLVCQDLFFIIMLILLKSFSENTSIVSIMLKVGLAIFILYSVNLLAQHKPSFISDTLDYVRTTNRELMTLFVIAFCFFCSWLSYRFGLSDIYGAFIAGLFLGNTYKHHHYILKTFEPITNILMTIFFIYIGLMLDMDILTKNLSIIILINILIIVVKYLSNYYINLDVNQNDPEFSNGCMVLSALLLTQVSEFSILMIEIVESNIKSSDPFIINLFEVIKSSCIVSLTIGCLVTVLTKRFLFNRGLIK
jgi:Kef-type K+ transport system membrane component KefB